MRILRKLASALAVAAGLFAATAYAAETQASDAACLACHGPDAAPQLWGIGRTKHGVSADGRTPGCVSCHGPSEAHMNGDGKPDVSFARKSQTPVAARNAACLSCHQGGNRIGWHASAHGMQDVSCASCHTVHAGTDPVRDKRTQTDTCLSCHKEQRSQIRKPSHHPILEGKMACSSCHDVHGDNPKQLIKSSTNDTCFTCHMEKRGPFVHNHQPVSEDCGICHQPHGTTVAGMLKARSPFLCQECHDPGSHPDQPGGLPVQRPTSGSVTGTAGTYARGCMNCHTNIHGGNSTLNSATAGRFRR